jgi:hypothetical protein
MDFPLDTDYLDYYPLQDGVVPVSSTKTTKLSSLSGERARCFQIGEDTECFLENRRAIRQHLNVKEFYQNTLDIEKTQFICDWLLKAFLLEGIPLPASTLGYVDDLDAIISQVADDIAVITVNEETGKDEATVLHLFAPSDWSADGAIGKSFGEIHEAVRKANGNLVIPMPEGMVKGLIKLPEPVQRVGSVSFRPNNLVSRHPKYIPEDIWHWEEDQNIFIRFERQVVVPMPEINSFMLIIRSYYNNLLDPKRLPSAQKALDNPSPDVYHKVFFRAHKEKVKEFLKSK